MLVDASALDAILTCEAEADQLTDLPERAASPITSPVATFKAAPGICCKRGASV
jgi:uncharacterized protein with PIN domain